MRVAFKKSVSKISPNHFDLLLTLISENLDKSSSQTLRILDIGGGVGEYWMNEKDLAHYQFKEEIEVTIMDAQVPNSQNNGPMHFLSGLAPSDLNRLGENSFDLVIALDVIEHLKKEDGYLLLYEMERIASRACLMFTPNGFVYQRPEPGNPFNAHISGWQPRDLKNFGWEQIHGHSGLKNFFGVYGLPKRIYSSSFLHNVQILLLLLSQILVFRLPRFSFAFSAVKRIKPEEKLVSLTRINLTKR